MMSIIQIQSECINTGFIVFYLAYVVCHCLQILDLLHQTAANTVIKKKIKKRIN